MIFLHHRGRRAHRDNNCKTSVFSVPSVVTNSFWQVLAVQHIHLLVLLGLSLLLTACSQPPPTAIRMGLVSSAVNLDPRFATDATSARINRLLYQRLVEFDSSSLPVPSLASWRQLNPQHYRFRLSDKEIRFSDGGRLTARDVVATFKSILDPATASPHRAVLHMIEQVDQIDEQTIDFLLSRPDPLFPAYLSIGILPAKGIEHGHPFHRQPLGSGAFLFVDWPEEGRLLLQRRRDGMAFEFITVKDPTVRVLKLLRDEIDLLQNDLPLELLGYLKRQPKAVIQQGRGSNFAYLGFNLEDEATGNLLVRRAIGHAIDREGIIHHLFGGAARAAQALLPPWHWAGAEALSPLPYDPELARQLLAKAGYTPQRPLRLSYKTSSDPFRIRIATIIQHQLAEVGIEVDVRSFDWGTFYGDIKAGRFQLYSLAWVGIKTPDIFRYVFASDSLPPDGANRGRFKDAEVDRLIALAESQPSPTEQAPVYHQLQALLLQKLPYVPLWYEDQVVVSRRGIQGYQLAEDGNYDALVKVERNSDVEMH